MGSSPRPKAEINVDLAEFVIGRKLTLGYCMSVGGNLVTWHRKK